MGSLDGVIFADSHVAIRHITDGTSKTLIGGEAVHDTASVDAIGNVPETAAGNKKDHWALGSDDIDGLGGPAEGFDPSEGLGSTAVPINYQNRFLGVQGCAGISGDDCQKMQLAYGSMHPGIANVLRCDGSVESIGEDVDEIVWRDLGTRAGQLPP